MWDSGFKIKGFWMLLLDPLRGPCGFKDGRTISRMGKNIYSMRPNLLFSFYILCRRRGSLPSSALPSLRPYEKTNAAIGLVSDLYKITSNLRAIFATINKIRHRARKTLFFKQNRPCLAQRSVSRQVISVHYLRLCETPVSIMRHRS